MTVWFTSDEHYGHANIIDYCTRPFQTTSHMQEELIARHNDKVSDKDIIYHLGDFAFSYDKIPSIVKRLNGKHILIIGNHDKVKRRPELYEGFSDIMNFHLYADHIGLCHYPVADFPVREKDMEFVFHGHVHTEWKTKGNRVNVGVDVWNWYPVEFERVLQAGIESVNEGPKYTFQPKDNDSHKQNRR